MKIATVLVFLVTLHASNANLRYFIGLNCLDKAECVININKDIDTDFAKIDEEIFPYMKSILLTNNTKGFKGPVNVKNVRRIFSEDDLWLWNYATNSYSKFELKRIGVRKNPYPNIGPTDKLEMCVYNLCNLYPYIEHELRCPNKKLNDISLTDRYFLKPELIICIQMNINYINFQNMRITWKGEFNGNFLADLIRLNFQNATFNSKTPLSAHSLKPIRKLAILDMPDNLHFIPISELFQINERLLQVDTPTFLFWRKEYNIIEKLDKNLSCLFNILIDDNSEIKIHCYKTPHHEQSTTEHPYVLKRLRRRLWKQRQSRPQKQMNTSTCVNNSSADANTDSFVEIHMICLIIGTCFILFDIIICALYFYKKFFLNKYQN